MYIVNLLLAVILFLQASFMDLSKIFKVILTILGVLNIVVGTIGMMVKEGWI